MGCHDCSSTPVFRMSTCYSQHPPRFISLNFFCTIVMILIPPLFQDFVIVRLTSSKVYDWEIDWTARIIPPLLF